MATCINFLAHCKGLARKGLLEVKVHERGLTKFLTPVTLGSEVKELGY